MALLVFCGRPQADPVRLGSYAEVTFASAELIADGKFLARHVEHRWHVQGVDERFSSLELRSRVDAYFGRDGERSKTFGSFDKFHLMDGIAYANGRVFAFFDPAQQDWYSLDLGSHWQNMAIVPAAEAQERPDRAQISE